TGAAAFATSGETAVPAAPAMNVRRSNPEVVGESDLSAMMVSAGWAPRRRLTGKKDSCSDRAGRIERGRPLSIFSRSRSGIQGTCVVGHPGSAARTLRSDKWRERIRGIYDNG